MTRLDKCLADLRQKKTCGFIPYITAGYPDRVRFTELLLGLPQAGVDLIEIGVPFSDPMADGPVIQASSQHALEQGIRLADIFAAVRAFRQKDTDTPVILMGYYNPIYVYGVERFIEDAAKAGIDGLIVADLPPEEETELRLPAEAHGLTIIRLITPTTDEKRLAVILKEARGYLYYVSVTGTTGTKSSDATDVNAALNRFRLQTDLPIAVGFGINTPAQAKAIACEADAVIVGSAIIKHMSENIRQHGPESSSLVNETLEFIKTLAQATHNR